MNKFKYLLVLILSISLISFITAEENTSDLKLLGKVIYLDAGHGGLDPGTVYKNIYEKDINLSIVRKLEKILEDEGAIVYLTRYGDYDLSPTNYNRKKNDLNTRAKIINRSNADIYISIHLNSISSSNWKGAQVFYDDVNSNNITIANIMQQQLKEDLNTKREVKEISNMLMNRKITIPGVLIEVGFLSNSNERYLLQKSYYQYKICNSINKGIIKYFNN